MDNTRRFTPLLLVILSALLISPVYAQDADDDVLEAITTSSEESLAIISDTLRGWHVNWIGGINGSQASFSNWSQGGSNTVNATGSTLFNLKYLEDRFGYNLLVNLKYGKARIEGDGTRKTDDKIAVSNKFSYRFSDSRFTAFGNVNFSTQFDKGFDYKVEPEPELISNFFAPAYFTQIVGIGFTPVDFFTAEAGMAFKETIVRDTTLSTRYGLDPGEKFRFEPGYSIILNLDKRIVSNVRLVSTLETFSSLRTGIESTDINFSNELIGKINDYLNTSFQFVLVYDDDFSKEVQLKQVLSVGFSFNLL